MLSGAECVCFVPDVLKTKTNHQHLLFQASSQLSFTVSQSLFLTSKSSHSSSKRAFHSRYIAPQSDTFLTHLHPEHPRACDVVWKKPPLKRSYIISLMKHIWRELRRRNSFPLKIKTTPTIVASQLKVLRKESRWKLSSKLPQASHSRRQCGLSE